MQGFRWPSDYVMTCHIITYRFGFLPRSLVGSVAGLFLGDSWYQRKWLWLVIISIAILFMLYIIYMIINYIWKEENIIGIAVLLVFCFSPYARFYLHEMGYYEQYGYLFVIALIYILPKINIKKNIIISATGSFIILLISETNAFLIIPIALSLSIICFINKFDNFKELIKYICFLCITYIPSGIYCILVWIKKVPVQMMQQLYEYDKAHVTEFWLPENTYWCFSGDRSWSEIWGRAFRPIPSENLWYPFILILFVSIMLYNYKNIRLMVTYILTSIISAFCCYSICILAWDLNRYYFCMYMAVLFISIFVINNYLKDIKYDKKDIFITLMMITAVSTIYDFRFSLFDGAVYNETWQNFFDLLKIY